MTEMLCKTQFQPGEHSKMVYICSELQNVKIIDHLGLHSRLRSYLIQKCENVMTKLTKNEH